MDPVARPASGGIPVTSRSGRRVTPVDLDVAASALLTDRSGRSDGVVEGKGSDAVSVEVGGSARGSASGGSAGAGSARGGSGGRVTAGAATRTPNRHSSFTRSATEKLRRTGSDGVVTAAASASARNFDTPVRRLSADSHRDDDARKLALHTHFQSSRLHQAAARRRNLIEDLDAQLTNSFTSVHLRRLFRVFDTDKDLKIKHREFQNGLMELGFAAAEDTRAVSKFLEDIDKDRTGFITEQEFIQYFQGLKRQDIGVKLSQLATKKLVSIRFVEYSSFKSDYECQIIPSSDVVDWLERHNEAFWKLSRKKRWLDVWGYNAHVMELLAAEFDIHPETLKDAALFQRAKVEVVNNASLKDEHVAQILFHLIYIPDKCKPFFLEDGEFELKSKSELNENPPALEFEQISIIIVDDRTIISIRADAVPGQADPMSQVLFETVCQRLADYSAMRPVHTSSVNHLAFDLVDAVLQKNYEIRDTLKDWESALEAGIREKAASLHTQHLYTLGKIADMYQRNLSPLQEILTLKNWELAGCASFFDVQEVLFRELYDDLSTITAETEGLKHTAKKLAELYKQIQADQMNKVLYILTVVTTVFIPAQFLTGLYGMNFAVMPELTWEYSYLIFWIVCVLIMVIVAFIFKCLKLFTV